MRKKSASTRAGLLRVGRRCNRVFMKDLRLSPKRARETAGGEPVVEAQAAARPVRLRITVQPRVPRVRSITWRTLPSVRLAPLPEDLSK